uniref:Enzymatic polyproteinlike [Metaseiulus occidentalis] n=2 Tax=Lepeophtheirus salmonis TaxID=72036 RepID=A0A0K2VE61_LEPSM
MLWPLICPRVFNKLLRTVIAFLRELIAAVLTIGYLGLFCNTNLFLVSHRRDNQEKLSKLPIFLPEKDKISLKDAQKCLGLLESIRPMFALVRVYYRDIQFLLKWEIEIFREGIQCLFLRMWWSTFITRNVSSTLSRPVDPVLDVRTDASLRGYGISLSDGRAFQGIWNEKHKVHINEVELQVVLISIEYID